MDRKHNPELVAYAKDLRKNMTKEERRLMIISGVTLHDFSVRKFWGNISSIFTQRVQSWSLSWMVPSIMKMPVPGMMRKEPGILSSMELL